MDVVYLWQPSFLPYHRYLPLWIQRRLELELGNETLPMWLCLKCWLGRVLPIMRQHLHQWCACEASGWASVCLKPPSPRAPPQNNLGPTSPQVCVKISRSHSLPSRPQVKEKSWEVHRISSNRTSVKILHLSKYLEGEVDSLRFPKMPQVCMRMLWRMSHLAL